MVNMILIEINKVIGRVSIRQKYIQNDVCFPDKLCILSVELNIVWWWDSRSEDLMNVEYLFIAIIHKPTLY